MAASAVHAQSAENVAVVINENSSASQRIGEYYARRRGLPPENVIRIRTAADETIDRARYAATIDSPVGAAIARARLQDRILYIVVTKGIPIRIAGSDGVQGTVSSVDSELTLLYRRMTGQPTPAAGRVDNPHFLGARPVSEARPFSHRDRDIYLVTRLDAFTEEEALALVDRALAPSKEGRIVLDQQDKLVNRTGEDWLEEAATRLNRDGHGDRVLLETTPAPARDVRPVIGYYSWGSNDPQNRLRSFGMGFVPGALAVTFVSSDARTFREPPPDWVPTGDADQRKWFAGTPQSLTGDLIREGATGTSGHVAEPYLQSTVRPEILFPAYLAGFNLAEAFYLSLPHLSWQTLVIGDPLASPFARQTLSRSQLEDDVDPETGLPGAFARRRLAIVKGAFGALGGDRAAVLVVRSEAALQRGDRAGARSTLEQAVNLAPRVIPLQLQLALLYQELQQLDAAIDRYRQVLALEPRNVAALNNLAYLLALHRNAAKEALPFAQLAVAGAPQNPTILDTLAWVEHLLGNHAAAVKNIAASVRGAPANAEIRFHAAVIYAAAGDRAAADAELQEALKLNPSLEGSEQIKQLRLRLEKLAAGGP